MGIDNWNEPREFSLSGETKHLLETGQAKLYLNMWNCGDEYCDCWQPQIEVRGPRTINGSYFPEAYLTRLWEGSFHSQPEREDWIQFRQEFESAREKYKPHEVVDFQWPYSEDNV